MTVARYGSGGLIKVQLAYRQGVLIGEKLGITSHFQLHGFICIPLIPCLLGSG